jgi:hypothetical protein
MTLVFRMVGSVHGIYGVLSSFVHMTCMFAEGLGLSGFHQRCGVARSKLTGADASMCSGLQQLQQACYSQRRTSRNPAAC